MTFRNVAVQVCTKILDVPLVQLRLVLIDKSFIRIRGPLETLHYRFFRLNIFFLAFNPALAPLSAHSFAFFLFQPLNFSLSVLGVGGLESSRKYFSTLDVVFGTFVSFSCKLLFGLCDCNCIVKEVDHFDSWRLFRRHLRENQNTCACTCACTEHQCSRLV